MQLETYISDLLYRYECVVIPDFGAFLTQAVSAKIDQETNTFYPPNKVVSFNEQLKKNDGLLANYMTDVEKIPYESAVKKIDKRTRELKSYLAQGETIVLKNIGEIALNSEGNINFEPSHSLNYLTEAFGLSQFVSPSVTREVYKEEVETLEEAVPLTITPEKRASTSSATASTSSATKRPYLKYAAVAVIALTLGGFAASKYYVGQIEQHNQMAQEEANKEIDSKIQEATFVIDNPLPSITLNVTKQSGNFHVVAGAFRVEENCDKKLEELRDLGYNARKIGANKYGLHQVVYSSYETRSEAQQALYSIRRNHNRDAWLLVQKLK
ncbi:MAG: SPOR domain-containing protein [Flavobacteriaceae bacterium]|nr:SPOR domain-containing protein [Flavobacteriaceae bacterium]